MSLSLSPAFGFFSSYWVALLSLDMRVCAYSYCISLFCVLVDIPWEACSFVEGKQRSRSGGRREVVAGLEETEGGETVFGMD